LEFAHSNKELEELHALLLRKLARIESNGLFKDQGSEALIIQQAVAGREFDIEIVNDLTGQYHSCLGKEKLASRSGECDMARTLEDPRFRVLGKRLATLLRHIGVLDVDLIEHGGKLYVIELNPRFGGCYPFSHLAGANLPAAYIAWAQGRSPRPSWLRVKPGIKSLKEISLVLADKPQRQMKPSSP
jgi:carbamoyl-phosphate synthase large subunit